MTPFSKTLLWLCTSSPAARSSPPHPFAGCPVLVRTGPAADLLAIARREPEGGLHVRFDLFFQLRLIVRTSGGLAAFDQRGYRPCGVLGPGAERDVLQER